MANQPEPTTAEAPEVRDAAEAIEEISRMVGGIVPRGVDGRPMTMISAAVSDKVPTVQFGNVVIGPVVFTRWIDDFGDADEGRQHRIDQARALMRDAEFAVGVERRLLQWAIDPASKVASPITAQDAFAAPPAGYNAAQLVDPRGVPLSSADTAASTATAAAQPEPPPAPAPAPVSAPQPDPPASVG